MIKDGTNKNEFNKVIKESEGKNKIQKDGIRIRCIKCGNVYLKEVLNCPRCGNCTKCD